MAELTDLSSWLDTQTAEALTTPPDELQQPIPTVEGIDREATTSAVGFQGDAEAILAISTDADAGIKDLVEAYKSEQWDDPEYALKIVEEYANKLREKIPNRKNLLDNAETLEIAPIKPVDVGYYIDEYEKQNLAQVNDPTNPDPLVRAYKDLIAKGIEDVATAGYQQANVDEDNSAIFEKIDRTALGALPGVAKALGVEKYVQRNLRADSNDTFASTLASGVGSILALPVAGANLAVNAGAFGYEQYKESRNAGASVTDAAVAAGIEATNQALDVITDKILLGRPLKKGAGVLVPGLLRALGEGGQEFAQDKISEYADFVGLDKEERNLLTITDSNWQSAAAGFVIGGGAHVLNSAATGNGPQPPPGASLSSTQDNNTVPPPAAPAPPLQDKLGLSKSIFPETEPPHRVAVVGEPVDGDAPVTTVEQASEPQSVARESAVAITDADEAFLSGEDGTTARVIDGAKKQAHTDAVIIPEDIAAKFSELQAQEPNDVPIIPRKDDLGRPYVKHVNVMPDLTINENAINRDPVMIPESEDGTGHVLQFSERMNAFGSIENSAAVSKGKITAKPLSPTQERKESTVAERLRLSNLNPHVKRLLELDKTVSDDLSYISDTRVGNVSRVNELFAKYDNNYLEFANDISQRPFGDITIDESIAAGHAANVLSAKADSVRDTNPEAAEIYDTLSAEMAVAHVAKRSQAGQELERYKEVPFDARTLIVNARVQTRTQAAAKAAVESGRTLKEVQDIVQEDTQLDAIDAGLNEREALIRQDEQVAQDRHDLPDKRIQALEQEATRLETAVSPEVTAIDQQLKDLERDAKLQEEQAKDAREDLQAAQDALEEEAIAKDKEADDLENSVQEFADELAALDKEIADAETRIKQLQEQPIQANTREVDDLKKKKKELGCK